MKILITGISGFVGSNFVKSWKNNYIVYGLDIVLEPIEGVENIYSWDDLDSIPAVDVVIHLAGMAHDTKDETKSDIYFQVNTGLTQKIYDYFLQSEIRTFFFFSSVKAAADRVEGDILTETVIPKPIGAYGESKIKAEKYLLDNIQKTKDKKTYILRPCMIHGVGNKGNLNLLYNIVKKGIPWPLGTYENRRSFCYIDNLIFVIDKIINSNIESGIYNICDDESLSTNQLIDLVCKSLNKKTKIWNIPANIIGFVAKVGTVLHLPLNEERLQKLTENYIVSNEKIKDVLNISVMPTKASDGLTKTFTSLK